MKDIAREANVSIATVSYILNDVKNQKISDETRERVLAVCKELGYFPNLAARTLAGKKSGLIGILRVTDHEIKNPWQDFTYCKFINQMEMYLSKNGYHMLFMNIDLKKPKLNVVLQRNLDCVIMLDVREDMFYEVSRFFTVPVIIVDGFLDDAWFHKIILDYDYAMDMAGKILGAKYEYIISDSNNNNGVLEKIRECSKLPEEDVYFAASEEGLCEFSQRHKGKKGIIFNEFIGLIAARYLNPADFVTVCTCGSSDILPDNMKKVVFSQDKPYETAKVVLSYLNGVFSDSSKKYTVLR